MKLLVPAQVIDRLKSEARRGRKREVGGILVGEHVGGETFRVADMSVQRSGGTAAHFVRDPEHHRAFLSDFFVRTGQDYQRFNYLGEWHSHPMFTPLPSSDDYATMHDIVHNPNVGANFAVLVIVRARRWFGLELSAMAFRRGAEPEVVEIQIEQDSEAKEDRSMTRRILNLVRR